MRNSQDFINKRENLMFLFTKILPFPITSPMYAIIQLFCSSHLRNYAELEINWTH